MAISLTDLPLNVLTEILARLPLKSLLVAKCLCKTFLHLASPTPYFNALQSAHPSPVLIFQFLVPDKDLGLNTLLYILDPENELDGASQILDVPDDKPFRITESPPDSDTFYSLKNSCNGLLLFCKDSSGQISDIMVRNPITNEYIMIGDEAEAEDEDLEVVGLLLGYSSVSNQYKILKTSVPRYDEYAYQYEDEDEDEDEDANYCQAEVFELGCQSKSWRLVAQPDPNFIRCDRQDIFLDGVIYCMNYIGVNDTIGFFDVEREEFGQIKLPDWDNTSYNRDEVSQYRNLGVVGACVCVIYEYHFMGEYYHFMGEMMVLWVLKKSGNRSIWTKNAVVRTRESCSLKPLQVMRNGEILFVNICGWGRGGIVCYNPKDSSLREVKVKMKCGQIPEWNRVVNLIPNFVSLKNALKIERKGIVNNSGRESSEDCSKILFGSFGSSTTD